jgi:hypothetical protein
LLPFYKYVSIGMAGVKGGEGILRYIYNVVTFEARKAGGASLSRYEFKSSIRKNYLEIKRLLEVNSARAGTIESMVKGET